MMMTWMEKGGPIMGLLLVCSVLALTIVAERFFYWLEMRRRRDPARVQEVIALFEQEGREAARALAGRLQDPAARVLEQGLISPAGFASGAMEAQARDEIRRMRRYLGVLETLITLAPLLGIFGTITGIIHAFGFLGSAAIPDPRSVASGIAEALLTTAGGLTVAILTIPPYHYFCSKTEQAAHDVERQATRLEALLHR